MGAAVRALSSGVENAPASAEVARSLAYTLLSWDANAEAAELLFGVLEQRPYEPQSYRDLAGAIWLQRPSITALLFEAALAGTWDGRFLGVMTVVQEEYALFAHALIQQQPDSPLAHWLRGRQQALNLRVPEGDLRVTMTWNTDATDIDLWPMYELVSCPTLAVRGAESNLLRRETWLQMAERGPRAKFAEIPGVGHAPMFMSDDQVAVVRDFLLAP